MDTFWLNCLQNNSWLFRYFETSSFFVQVILRTLSTIISNQCSIEHFKKLASTGENTCKLWLIASRTKKCDEIIEFLKSVLHEEYLRNPLGQSVLLEDSKILKMVDYFFNINDICLIIFVVSD